MGCVHSSFGLDAQMQKPSTIKFVTHSKKVLSIATSYGWLPGARYTNLRDVRNFDRIGFLDIDWKDYSFKRHLEAAKTAQPLITVAKDIENRKEINRTLDEAWELSQYSEYVVIVPKDPDLTSALNSIIPEQFILGYSVTTSYGGTSLPPEAFKRPVHLLGGRPDVQRKLANIMPVFSFDCNRFTIDAAYGDFFDGDTFRPHPIGGYDLCLIDSIKNINALWYGYDSHEVQGNGK
ncbi:MAG: DUF6610 family protein [Sedimentisphaerales bacterium]